MEPAGHVRRLVAILLDYLLVSCLLAVGVLAMVYVGNRTGLAILLIALIAAIVYEPYLIASKGATLGKRSVGLRVVNEYGEPVTGGQSIARWVSKQIFTVFVIPLVVPLFSYRRRGLHDIVVSTYVIKA